MNEYFDEEQLHAVLKSAKDRRMEQLESEFAATKEYLETTEAKEKLINQMEDLIPDQVKLMLGRYDDVAALQLGKAQDFFYERGLIDCLTLVSQIFINTRMKPAAPYRRRLRREKLRRLNS